MKKLAIFQTDLNYGGIQKSIINILNNIDYSKYEIDLYLLEKDNIFINDIDKRVNIKYIKKMPFLSRAIPFNLLKKIYKCNIDKEYDISIDFNSYSNECAINAIKVKSKKKIAWIHNDIKIKIKEEKKYKLMYFFFKNKYKYFDKFIAVSKGALESFMELHQLSNKEYEVIPNLIDTKEIKRKIEQAIDFKVDDTKINICSTGRLVHQKGFDILLEEINNMKDKLTNHHFYIIGDGPEYKKILKYIEKNNLESLVTLLGYQKNPFSIMDKMDAFILLSRYEGQGMVFLEAKALGLDIIMPKHLEKYVEDIKGTSDIRKNILKLSKNKKEFDNLNNYNNSILNKLNNL